MGSFTNSVALVELQEVESPRLNKFMLYKNQCIINKGVEFCTHLSSIAKL